MKSIITFLLLAAMAVPLMAQFANDQANLEKYWYYRKRLQDNFLYVNPYNVNGSNIPVDRIQADTRNINGQIEVGHVTKVEWDDCNGALPYYIMVLATEYKLLKKSGQLTDATATLQELNRAVQALKRLDLFADNVENGVFRRSDLQYLLEDKSWNEVDTRFQSLVNHFDNIRGINDPVGYDFAERFKEKHLLEYPSSPLAIWETKYFENMGKAKFNSVDNVIKFIEAEAVVRKLLGGEGSTAEGIVNTLKNSVKLMLVNMYHPGNPRKLLNREEYATGLGLMQRTWYLEDPDLDAFAPKNLIPEPFGGAGDLYTFAYSYGLAQLSQAIGLDYKGTDFSAYFSKRLMNFDNKLAEVRVYEVSYECDSNVDTVIYFIGADNSRFTPNFSSYRLLCGQRTETLLKVISPTIFPDKSFWMIRALAAVNDISSSYLELFSRKNNTYRFLRDCVEQYPYTLEHYPLIWSVLYSKEFIEDDDRAFVGSLLNSAPLCGPYNHLWTNPVTGYDTYKFEVYDWSSPNRYTWPELNGTGGTDDNGWKRSGYFNGIDYMLLHNLYWLTKVSQVEYATTYVDNIIMNQAVNLTVNSEFAFARTLVKLKPGFKVTVSGPNKFFAATNPNIRSSYDQNNTYTKLNVSNYATNCNCEPIYRAENDYSDLKSAEINGFDAHGFLENVTITIFPNPGEEQLTVNSTEPINRILVFNSMGKVQFELTAINTESHTFSIAHLPEGMYLVKTTTINGYEETEKIIKKN